jgi:V-type H+-transporting ATPase subunit E
VNIVVNKQHYLIERQLGNSDQIRVEDYTIEKSEEDLKCFGGIILTNESGLIICKNTLDTRIDLAFNVILPKIRSNLFPQEGSA